MNLLEESRAKIDSIDEQIVKLFEQRFQAVQGVVKYKMENGMQVLDSSREQAILKKNIERLTDQTLIPYFQDFYQHMMDVSKNYQKDIINKK